MKNTVIVLSKKLFNQMLIDNNILGDAIETKSNVIFISISNADDEDRPFLKDYENTLSLIFDDMTDMEEQLDGHILFNDNHAAQIIDFLDKHKDFETCVVHCMAGQSRSGAVGYFIDTYYGKNDYFAFKKINPTIKPNFYILDKLKKKYTDEDNIRK